MRRRQPTTNAVSLVYYSRTFHGGEWPRDYYPIAGVAASDLEDVFGLTTQGDHLCEDEIALVSWLQPARSMMVGDVVENAAGFFRCLKSGWEKL